MKWKDIQTRTICFDADVWDKIIKRVGEIEDFTGEETTISDVVNDLVDKGLKE